MILGLIVIVLLMVWARAFYGSMQAYHKGETYLEEHQYIKAITFFDRSIHWYTPFNPYVRKSAESLWDIGNRSEQLGDTKMALIAFRTIKRGFHAASSFYSPGKSWIKRCELKINTLVAMEQAEKEGTDDLKQSIKTIHQSQEILPPSIFWSIILEIGLLGWIGSVIAFIMFTFRPKGESRYSIRSIIMWIGITCVFFALWIVGMMKA